MQQQPYKASTGADETDAYAKKWQNRDGDAWLHRDERTRRRQRVPRLKRKEHRRKQKRSKPNKKFKTIEEGRRVVDALV